MLAQILDDPDATAWLRWLNWGYWLTLAACIFAVIAGGATIVHSSSTDHGRWGRHMVAAGLAGALALSILAPFINWCYDLIVS